MIDKTGTFISDQIPAVSSASLTDLPIPEFSVYIKQCLRNRESAKVWNKAVDEAAHFYLAFYPSDVDNQKAYTNIGQKLHKAFPDIKREGEYPWVSLTFWCNFLENK